MLLELASVLYMKNVQYPQQKLTIQVKNMLFLEFYSDFRSEKSYKGVLVYVHGQTLGGIATTLQDLLQPPRHEIRQVSSFTPTEQRREGEETGP